MSDATWYMRDRGQKRGPFSQEKLLVMYRRGQLSRFHEISQDGKSWVKAATLLEAPMLPEPASDSRAAMPSRLRPPRPSGGLARRDRRPSLAGDRPRRKRRPAPSGSRSLPSRAS